MDVVNVEEEPEQAPEAVPEPEQAPEVEQEEAHVVAAANRLLGIRASVRESQSKQAEKMRLRSKKKSGSQYWRFCFVTNP